MSFTKLSSSSSFSSSWVAGASAVALASSLVACVIEDAPPRHYGSGDQPAPTDPGTGAGTPVGSGTVGAIPPSDGTSSASPAPMLAIIDTDQVMNADPGQGVGVFTEYATGGKWHVWWTCDTTLSKQSCDVSLSATTAAGTISNVDAGQLQGGFVVTPDPSRVEARVTTSTQVHGITFTTNPGAVITLEATIGGLKEGPGPNRSFFFFVQDGKINGGFGGRLTNPLQLQGKTP
jgi:hypothetical protein